MKNLALILSLCILTITLCYSNVVYSADKDDELVGWLRQMSNERFRHVPVVDKTGKLINIMSQGDFVSYTWPDLLYQVKELAKEGYPKINQLVIVCLGILVYTLVLMFAFKNI